MKNLFKKLYKRGKSVAEMTDEEKEFNTIKNGVFSGIYSIIGVWASAIYLIADLFMNDTGAAVISWFIMIAIVLVSLFTNKRLKAEIEKKTKKAVRWCDAIDKHSKNAGYIGIIVLTLSFLMGIITLV